MSEEQTFEQLLNEAEDINIKAGDVVQGKVISVKPYVRNEF